ncbi:MAG: hypothetical protein OXF25_04480 [Cyanobacteria bacterium MAG CAR3_bin_5]|nr:hypothetical protein [Cyanobacteria bacterium MAG CAR3_bin_5]
MAFLLALGIGPSLGQYEASPDQSQEVSQGQDQDHQDASQEESQQGASPDQQGSDRLSLFGKPTVSIPQVTVPQFEGISIGGISAVEIEDRRGAIYWWNDTVARQLTSLLSKMVTATGDISVRKTDNSKYTLLAEVTSYKETKEEIKSGGGRVLIFGVRGGRSKVESAISMNIRIIDTQTQEVKREATIRGVAHAEVKGGGGSVNLGIVSFQGGQSNKEVDPPIEEAVHNTLEKATAYIHCALIKKDSCLQDYDTLQFKL